MSLSYRQELARLAERIKGGRRREFVEYAIISDTGPYAQYGFVLGRLVDGTQINVRAWAAYDLKVNQEIMVVRIGEQDWNWYALIAVNGSETSTIEGGRPFAPPPLAGDASGSHELNGSQHTGSLPWSRIDTAGGRVDLASQVQGILPRHQQEAQVYKVSWSVPISAGAGQLVTGSFPAANSALVREILLTGGDTATLRLLDAPGGNELYATTQITTPFSDRALPCFLEDATRARTAFYELTNHNSLDAALFTLTVVAMVLGG